MNFFSRPASSPEENDTLTAPIIAIVMKWRQCWTEAYNDGRFPVILVNQALHSLNQKHRL
jgi:hypothetical protein